MRRINIDREGVQHMPNNRIRRELLRCVALLLVGVASQAAWAQQPAQPAQPTQPAQPALQPPTENAREPRVLDVAWTFEDVDIDTLTRRLSLVGINVPVEMSGEITARLSAAVPLASLSDGSAYRFTGVFESRRLRIAGASIEDFYAELNYRDGVLRLTSLRGRLGGLESVAAQEGEPRGSFAGVAAAQLVPRGNFRGELNFSDVPLAILGAAGSGDARIDGRIDGSATVRGPVQVENIVRQLQASFQATVRGFRLGDRPPLDIAVDQARLQNATLEVPAARIALPAGTLRLAGTLQLEDDQAYNVRADSDELSVASLWSLATGDEPPSGTDGTARIDAQLSGKLATADQISATGTLRGETIRIAGFVLGSLDHRFAADQDSFELVASPETETRLQRIASRYRSRPEAFELNQLQISGWGGEIAGSGRIALEPDGAHAAQLRWSDLQLAFRKGPLVPLGNEVTFATSGDAGWSVPADRFEYVYSHSAEATFRVDDLRLDSGLLGALSGSALIRSGRIEVDAAGRLLGGTTELDISATVEPEDRWQDLLQRASGSGQLTLSRVPIEQIDTMVRGGRQARDWDGEVTVVANWSEGNPVTGRLLSSAVAYRGQRFLTNLEATWTVDADGVSIRRARGALAGGAVQVAGNWSFAGGPRLLRVRVASIAMQRAMPPFMESVGESVTGNLDASLLITGGRVLRVTGSICGRHALVYGVTVEELRSRLTATADLGTGRWKTTFRDVRGDVAHGYVSGSVEASSSVGRRGRADVMIRGEAANVDFQDLIAALVDERMAAVGRGKLTGRFELSGAAIESADDWQGTIVGRLDGTQASAVPGLSAAQNYLGLASLSRVQFDSGLLQARIRQGRMHLQRFAATGDQMQVFADGSVGLRGGRMNVDAIITTGNFAASGNLLVALAQRYALTATGPIGIVSQANQLASGRTIYVHVGGSVARPHVRLRPLETATRGVVEIALQHFIGRPVGLQSTGTFTPGNALPAR